MIVDFFSWCYLSYWEVLGVSLLCLAKAFCLKVYKWHFVNVSVTGTQYQKYDTIEALQGITFLRVDTE